MAAPVTTEVGPSDDPVVEAITDAYRRFHPELVRRCLRVAGDRAAAEEAAQEAFARALEKRPPVDSNRPIEAWLTTVGTRVAIDSARRDRRVVTPLADDLALAEDVSEAAARSDARRRFGGALRSLPDAHRRALILFGLEGLSYSQIADAEGVSLGAVKMTIHRARERLKSTVNVHDLYGAVPVGSTTTPEGRKFCLLYTSPSPRD